MRFSLLALALLAAPAFAQADAPLRPGDVDVAAIQPYDASYRIFVKQGAASSGMPFGSVSESLSIDDGVALHVVSINAPGQTQVDSIWFAWPSLDPVRIRSEQNGAVEDLAFDGLAVSGTLREGGDFDATLGAPAFGPASSDLIARSLLDNEDTEISMVTFDSDADDHTNITTLAFGGTEDIEGRTARAVTRDDGEQVITRYYDTETSELLQFTFSPQPGITVEIRRSDLGE